MELMTFALASLAVYRVSTDLAWETGPFGIYAGMRGGAMVHGPDWIGEGVTCPVCWSFWIALPIGFAIDPSMGFVYWLAIAGAVALAVRATDHD